MPPDVEKCLGQPIFMSMAATSPYTTSAAFSAPTASPTRVPPHFSNSRKLRCLTISDQTNVNRKAELSRLDTRTCEELMYTHNRIMWLREVYPRPLCQSGIPCDHAPLDMFGRPIYHFCRGSPRYSTGCSRSAGSASHACPQAPPHK
eukprot:3046755-Pyramimonas_sp.AAC.1